MRRCLSMVDERSTQLTMGVITNLGCTWPRLGQMTQYIARTPQSLNAVMAL